MIFDHIRHLERYTALNPFMVEALNWIAAHGDAPDGRHSIRGDDVFALVSTAEGRGHDAAPLESHRKYIDIQLVLSGTDEMGWLPVEDARKVREPYSETKDIVFYHDAPVCWVNVPAGYFTLFFPHDAHAPLAGRGSVRKMVVKVRVV